MIVLAALDYIFQRWTYEKNLRMTKREVQEEFKQVEGDPQIKSRIRSIQRELARKRMMAEVPKADVIITNPTHLAVALHYRKEEMTAPRVVAKGAGFIAEKIREIAAAHKIPLVENKPLAQALYRTVELGQTIPSNLYQVVADVLAHVYRMKKKVF
jgi:flagellar biosynthetic protein FlhB